jgi:nucleotide-binding universal stress UspA family protein
MEWGHFKVLSREAIMSHPQRILHPTDYSACSAYAFQIASDLASQHQAKLLILHVAETLGPENVTFGEAVSQLEPAAYRRRLEADIRQRMPSPAGVTVEYILAEGDIAQEIPRQAKERNCDLIVMGTHSRTGLTRLFMSSTAEKVIQHAPCPVLVAKAPQQ